MDCVGTPWGTKPYLMRLRYGLSSSITELLATFEETRRKVAIAIGRTSPHFLFNAIRVALKRIGRIASKTERMELMTEVCASRSLTPTSCGHQVFQVLGADSVWSCTGRRLEWTNGVGYLL